MIDVSVDVAVLGSGFGGSLMAMLLARIGLSSVLIDRACHPRFAIGESSTPNADLILLELARDFDLPRIAPLAKYGTWQAECPDVVCGIKRGFSYFHHSRGQPFCADAEHTTELLVAASPDDAHSDTHWLRSSVDGFLAREAISMGVPLLDNTAVALTPRKKGWRLNGMRHQEPVQIDCELVIDGTGEFGLVPRALGIANCSGSLQTSSRALLAHFASLRPFRELLAASGALVADHPFECDHAALHHVFDEGWMYQLGFNNGVTSAGFLLDCGQRPHDESLSPQQEWNELLVRYPSIGEQFAGAEVVAPAGGLVRTRRLQRRMSQIAGDNWALLPHTAGFIDPLHSTGIAQTLCGIRRLAIAFRQHWGKATLPLALARYAASVDRELALIDKLVSGCYLARRHFRLFAAHAMLYFAAATTSEQRRAAGLVAPDAAFLLADDPAFCQLVNIAWERMGCLASLPAIREAEIDAFEALVARSLEPYNTTGLCDRAVRNMYRFTAIEKR